MLGVEFDIASSSRPLGNLYGDISVVNLRDLITDSLKTMESQQRDESFEWKQMDASTRGAYVLQVSSCVCVYEPFSTFARHTYKLGYLHS